LFLIEHATSLRPLAASCKPAEHFIERARDANDETATQLDHCLVAALISVVDNAHGLGSHGVADAIEGGDQEEATCDPLALYGHLLPLHLQRTRFELIVERKLRRRQLTDDGNVEITGRDLRERTPTVGQGSLFETGGARVL
jgi:hypothetical protein